MYMVKWDGRRMKKLENKKWWGEVHKIRDLFDVLNVKRKVWNVYTRYKTFLCTLELQPSLVTLDNRTRRYLMSMGLVGGETTPYKDQGTSSGGETLRYPEGNISSSYVLLVSYFITTEWQLTFLTKRLNGLLRKSLIFNPKFFEIFFKSSVVSLFITLKYTFHLRWKDYWILVTKWKFIIKRLRKSNTLNSPLPKKIIR